MTDLEAALVACPGHSISSQSTAPFGHGSVSKRLRVAKLRYRAVTKGSGVVETKGDGPLVELASLIGGLAVNDCGVRKATRPHAIIGSYGG
jgi:hypothetical protein